MFLPGFPSFPMPAAERRALPSPIGVMVAFQLLLSSSDTELPFTEPVTFGRGYPLFIHETTLPLAILTVVRRPKLLRPDHVPSQEPAAAATFLGTASADSGMEMKIVEMIAVIDKAALIILSSGFGQALGGLVGHMKHRAGLMRIPQTG